MIEKPPVDDALETENLRNSLHVTRSVGRWFFSFWADSDLSKVVLMLVVADWALHFTTLFVTSSKRKVFAGSCNFVVISFLYLNQTSSNMAFCATSHMSLFRAVTSSNDDAQFEAKLTSKLFKVA